MESDTPSREATHSGSWYNANPSKLSRELSTYLSSASKNPNYNKLKSIIVPHAGYRYCAPTASEAFININPANYDRIFVLGPSHHVAFPGVGLTPFSVFETPFGNINVDIDVIKELSGDKEHLFSTLPEEVDENEHSIEMELPFLKMIYGSDNFKLVPLMVGRTNLEMNRKIAESLQKYYDDPKSLFVISSDFCHWGKRFGFTYYDKSQGKIWESTEKLDKMAMEIIGRMDPNEFNEYFIKYKNTICGRSPISIVLCNIEKYKQTFTDKKVSFDLAAYSQSERITDMNDSSVSYAAGVNFIE